MARRAPYRKAVFATALLSALLPGIAARAAEAPAAAAAQAPEVDDRRILVMLKLGAEHYRAGADYGGGGYGDPRNRDRAEISNDVAQGFVSPDKAKDYYGWRASASVLSSLSA